MLLITEYIELSTRIMISLLRSISCEAKVFHKRPEKLSLPDYEKTPTMEYRKIKKHGNQMTD